jgi:hypothetical protein
VAVTQRVKRGGGLLRQARWWGGAQLVAQGGGGRGGRCSGLGTAATGGQRGRHCATVEAGEGGDGLTCGVQATVPVGRVKPESKQFKQIEFKI